MDNRFKKQFKKYNRTSNANQRRNIYKTQNRTIKKISSYSPTINKDLITLSTIPREEIQSCNLQNAYLLKEPLKIAVSHKFGNILCLEYYKPEAEKLLLKNLKANKHVNPKKIVPPIQSHGNCWFNAMFANFFISDKGRKFFQFFRQLMIKGTQKNKSPIPDNLRDVFALLNFGIYRGKVG